MTPEAKRRKNQKKKLKQKQKKAAAAAAAAASVIAANAATDVSRTVADVDSISTSESTVIFKDSTVTDEANMNTVSDPSISKDNTNQKEERGNIVQENKEEEKIRVEPEKLVEIVESSLEIGSHQISSEENTQVQEIEQHDKLTGLTNQMVDYQNSDHQIVNTGCDQEINNDSFNKEMSDPQNLNVDGHPLTNFDEDVTKGNDLNKITISTEELENNLIEQTNDFNEIINRSEEEQNETNIEKSEDKEIEYESSAEDLSIQNESQFSEKLGTVDKKSEPLPTNTVTQNEKKTPQEIEEHQGQIHEDLQESLVIKQHIEDVDFSTMINSEELSTNYDGNQNNGAEVSNNEIAITQSESISQKSFTTQENTIEDLFMSSPHDELMPWEQQEKVHQNGEKENLQNVADEPCERKTEPIGKVDELFANENTEELLPWNENKANEETKISDGVIAHNAYSVDASMVSTSNNENGNPQKDNNNEYSDDVSGLFGEETNKYHEYWLHETDNNVPSSPFASDRNTFEPTNDKFTALNPEPIKSTVNDSFKKFSFLQDDNDLLDDDSDSFLESEDELATRSEDRPQNDILNEGIILDDTYRKGSNGQVQNTSKYKPITTDLMASNKNIPPTQESMVGIVLPKQINHISKTVSDIQSSQSPAIQLPNQDPTRSSFNSQNAKQVIEKLSVEKKKSDAYDFPMDLIMDKIKPVHAKPVGVPSPKLNTTSFLPKNVSRHTSTSIQSTSGYQSLNAASNMSMPINPYAAVVKKENASKQGAPPAAPVGVVLPSINLPSLPTFQNNNKKMALSMNSPPLHGNRKSISNTSSTPNIHPVSISNAYAPQTGVIRAPSKIISQPLQYAHQSLTTVQSSQVPSSNTDPHRPVSISPVNTNLNYTLSAQRGNHARKNSSLYSPNSNENSSRYAPTVHPQYQQQSQTIQSNVIPQQFPSIPATLESNTTKSFAQQINHPKNTYPYSSHRIKNDNTLVESNVASQLEPYSSSQINHMGSSYSVSEGNYINKQLRNHSNEMLSEVDNASLLSRQFPLFQFNSSSKIVYGIPIAMGGYTGTNTPAISSLNIKSYDSIVKPDPVLKSFPGPLTQKSKRKDVEQWLSTIIGELNVDVNSDEYLIWKILQIKFLDNYSTNDLSEAIYSTYELQTYLSQPFNPNLSQLNAHRLDNTGLMRILALLQVGDQNSALRDALFHKDYTMALLIGSLISKDKWVDVVDLYFAEEVNNPTCINLLSLIFQAFMGNSKAIIEKFYSNNERATWMLNNWRAVVAAVLKHCIHCDDANKIPAVIIEFLVELAIFLYHKGLKLAASVLFIIVDIPLTNMPVLKDSDVTFTYIGNPKSVQGIVWSELYQYYCVMQNSKLSNYDVLLLQKTYHGMCLQEQGLSNLATKYSDYVASRLKQLNKKDVGSLNLSIKLEELQSRLIGSNSGWLLKPKLSSVWGQLDKSFNKYIGGDDDTSPTPSDTFGKFMVGNKGVIRSPSSNAFNNYIGDNVETSSVVMGIGKMSSKPNIYSSNKQSYIKKPIERPSLVPASQTYSTPNVLEVVKPSSIKPDMYSLNTNNSVPSKLSSHFDIERSPNQIDEEISSTIASEKGNETLEEQSMPILLPKKREIMTSPIDDVPTELQSMQYSIPLPVDNSDASLIGNPDILSISEDGSNVPPHIISDAHEQKVENVRANNSLVDIDNSQPLENNSSDTIMKDNEVPYLFTSVPVSQQANHRVFSSKSVTNDLIQKTEDEVEAGIGVSKSIVPPSVSKGSVSYPAVQISMTEPVNNNNLNDHVIPNPATISTKYNNFVSPDSSINNMDDFEPRIRPSSVVQGVPSVKTSEEINIQYNDEVEDDSDEEEEEEITNTKKDTVTKDKDKKNNTSSQKSGWFSWLKKDPNEKKVVKAKLGHQNNFYYDEKLKRWVNKDATEDEKKKMQEAVAPPPPPVVRRKDTVVKSKPRPSFSHPSTNSTSSIPVGAPPVTILPVNPLSGQPMIQTSNNLSSTKPRENSVIPNPPVTNGNKSINLAGKTSNGLDDILNISTTTTASRRKKKLGRGYVNVMENR